MKTGKGVTVAVLDSGVHASHPHIGEASIAETASIDPSFADTVDRLGHGTAVAAAILDLAPRSQLIIGKIFDRSLTTNATMLARGIDWAAERGARLINLSLGTANEAHAKLLTDAVTRAADSGAVVVSAREAKGVLWLPGALPGVVSVTADPALERDTVRVEKGVVVAAPYPRPIPGVPRDRNLSGVSFAVANVTGHLARALEARDDLRTAADFYGALSGTN